MIDYDAYLVSQYGPDLDGEAECRCQIVGWSRDPYEPHIPAQPEWEQADDCPVHPRKPERHTPDAHGNCSRWCSHADIRVGHPRGGQ